MGLVIGLRLVGLVIGLRLDSGRHGFDSRFSLGSFYRSSHISDGTLALDLFTGRVISVTEL